jgi:hypothetical protein
MDKAGRGSIGPAVGPGRRKDKRNYPGPQAEAEDNVDHGARQRSAGYEETAGRTHSCTDTEEGAPSSNGTTPGAGNRGHCAGGRHKEEHGTNSGRVRRDDQRRDCSAGIGRTQGEDRAGSNTSKGAHREVPGDRRRDRRSTQGLGGSGRATCQCWGPVGCRPNQKERLFLEEKHARGKRQLEGKATHMHAWKT